MLTFVQRIAATCFVGLCLVASNSYISSRCNECDCA